ncbi:hypothetical protein BDA99DRAFT_580054, partial [Phascolomyces articulosus]
MSIIICPHCFQSGHRRRNHHDCLANPARMATRMQNENETIMFERERRCSSCGGLGHCRRTHSECPLNPANIDGIIQLPALFEVPDNTNISNGRRCASCGGLGHSQRTHQDYLLNSENTQQPQPRM